MYSKNKILHSFFNEKVSFLVVQWKANYYMLYKNATATGRRTYLLQYYVCVSQKQNLDFAKAKEEGLCFGPSKDYF